MSDSMHANSDAGPGVFSLTQIRHLMRVEFSRAQRYSYPVTCIAVACDRMGHLRDLYGYEFRESVMDEVIAVNDAVVIKVGNDRNDIAINAVVLVG